MANSRLFQFRYSYERDLVDVFARVSIGASGAPTLVAGKGIVSVTRVSAGKYTFVLKDNFNRLMEMNCSTINATGISVAPDVNISSDLSSQATNPSVQIQCANNSAAVTDPASGDVLLVQFTFRNAST